MDDYSITSLYESKNEWAARLVNILTPLIMEGFRSIFEEAYKLCKANKELDKYLMTFQNFLCRVPNWNETIIQNETARVKDRSACGYLEELIACVHIVQLKSMTYMRVGNKQKKIDIAIPELHKFIHTVYVNCARKLYTNVYIFEINIPPLQIQKNNREFEIIVKECIFNTIRDNIPIEELLRMYMDESIEDVVEVNEKEEIIREDPIVDANGNLKMVGRRKAAAEENASKAAATASATATATAQTSTTAAEIPSRDLSAPLSIVTPAYDNDGDSGSGSGNGSSGREVKFNTDIHVKAYELDEDERKSKMSEDYDDDGDGDDEGGNGRLTIGDNISLETLDIDALNQEQVNSEIPLLLDDIEVLG